MTNFVDLLQKESNGALPNVSVTENGALGYKTSGKSLVDLNFMLSSMRDMPEEEIWRRFLLAYNENPTLAVTWLFFARDVRGGCGERRTFRLIFKRLCSENEPIALRLLQIIPFYGRWDDLIDLFFSSVPCKIRDAVGEILREQFAYDISLSSMNKPISLLAKWLPSLNTSSKETRRRAEVIRHLYEMRPRQYRKALSALRQYIDVTERKMSANEWSRINYETVPSRAAMTYRDAFERHDGDRYIEYLTNVNDGKAKINAGALYPYDIVHAYCAEWKLPSMTDETLEAQWKALPDTVPDNGSTLVVVDGSGSMGATIGNTSVTCHDVARSLGIYFSEKLSGPLKDSFITFSADPKFVRFTEGISLLAKLSLLECYDDCSNTNIEKTFDLILDVAVKNHLKQSELPANILIVSDMEFDDATRQYGYGMGYDRYSSPVDRALFDTIRDRWAEYGYKIPRLVFWNVCSRTGTIPLSENDFGVALVSGFSPNIADMVMSGELDPFRCLEAKLLSDRYDRVREALRK